MNCILPLYTIAAFSLVACDNMSSPISHSGSYDPLLPAGSRNTPTQSTVTTFSAGQFVRTSMDNTAFFKTRPNGNADADKLLKRGISMKVISNSGGYVKVELDSGEIGFIPSVMIEDPKAAPQVLTNSPGEYQIYPPLPGTNQAIPTINPAGLPPEGAIPTVIDPDATNANAPVPHVTPTVNSFPTPSSSTPPQVEATPKAVNKTE